jgi:hypothetical protein
MDTDEFEKLLRGLTVAEFCLPGGRRTSLEALGLIAPSYDPERFGPMVGRLAALAPVAAAPVAEDLALVLLEQVRRARADSPLAGLDLTDARLWGTRSLSGTSDIAFVLSGQRGRMLNWLPSAARPEVSRRGWLLCRRLGLSADEALQFLANRVFETYTAIVDACCDAWNALVNAPDTIRSITSREWAKDVIS